MCAIDESEQWIAVHTIVSPLFWSPWSESPAELTLIVIRFHAVGKYLPCMQMLGP